MILSQVDYSNHFVGPGYYDPYPLDSHWIKKSFNVRLNNNAANGSMTVLAAAHGPPKRRNSFSMGIPPGSGSMGTNKQQKGLKGKGVSRTSMDISAIEKPQSESSQQHHHHKDVSGGAVHGDDALIDLSLDTVHVGEHVAVNKVTRQTTNFLVFVSIKLADPLSFLPPP